MIRRIAPDWDMRSMKELRRLKRGLKHGQIVIALNKKCNIAKVIDCEGGLYDAPRPAKGLEFDADMIQSLMWEGLGIEFTMLRRIAA